MRATSIVRHIDDLGRVVIPKEIRRTMRLPEGTALEIYTDREDTIILKKYSPMAEMSLFAKQYCEALGQVFKHTILITDRDQVVAAVGPSRKEFQGQSISKELEDIIQNRENVMTEKGKGARPVFRNDQLPYTGQMIYPVISEGDVIGAVIFASCEENAEFGEAERKAAACAAAFLGKQMTS